MGLRFARGVLAIFSVGIVGTSMLYAHEDPETVIEEKCANDWPDNHRMRAACIEQQGQVLNKSLTTPVDPRLALQDHTLLREKCAKDWPDDYRSRAKCEENQIKGFQKLQAPPPKDVTLKEYSVAMAQCASDWPDDFRMRARCFEEHIAALRLKREEGSDALPSDHFDRAVPGLRRQP